MSNLASATSVRSSERRSWDFLSDVLDVVESLSADLTGCPFEFLKLDLRLNELSGLSPPFWACPFSSSVKSPWLPPFALASPAGSSGLMSETFVVDVASTSSAELEEAQQSKARSPRRGASCPAEPNALVRASSMAFIERSCVAVVEPSCDGLLIPCAAGCPDMPLSDGLARRGSANEGRPANARCAHDRARALRGFRDAQLSR